MQLSARLTVLLVILLACGCDSVRGNGKLEKETRAVPAFSKIKASGAYELKVTLGKERSLKLQGDDNLLPLVETAVKGNRLEIGSKKNLKPSKGLMVEVTIPDIGAIESSGAVKATVEGVNNDGFRFSLSGAGSVSLQGKTSKLELDISGAGSIKARDLKAEDVIVRASGAGSVEVYASKFLEVDISGVGSVSYYGNPKRVKQDISGVGKLVKK